LPALRELWRAAPRREEAEVPDADEAFRQHVQEEAPQEFLAGERERPHLTAGFNSCKHR
jgi:hypothetical protein